MLGFCSFNTCLFKQLLILFFGIEEVLFFVNHTIFFFFFAVSSAVTFLNIIAGRIRRPQQSGTRVHGHRRLPKLPGQPQAVRDVGSTDPVPASRGPPARQHGRCLHGAGGLHQRRPMPRATLEHLKGTGQCFSKFVV